MAHSDMKVTTTKQLFKHKANFVYLFFILNQSS